VLVRSRLLDFLKSETETRGASVFYATHIFDGLDRFPTHVCHLQLGQTLSPKLIEWPVQPGAEYADISKEVMAKMEDPNRVGSRLFEVAMSWLVEDKRKRVELEQAGVDGFRTRGASKQETTDSEIFYKKCVSLSPYLAQSLTFAQRYDYSH
jgi:CCR4-NOT complex subunit CAF16